VSDLTAQLVITSLVLAVPATVSIFIRAPGRPPLRGAYRSLVAAALVVAGALAVGAVIGAGRGGAVMVAAALALAVVAFGRTAAAWTLRGLLAWSLTVVAGAAYLLHVALWMARADLEPMALVGGSVLWLVELFVYVLALGYIWELVDVLARWDWQRSAELSREVEQAPGRRRGRFVSLHVPTHNEPPDLVIETLNRLLDLEYDDFEVLVIDNNTDDPELWRPVERFCRSHERLGFFHLADWPGHKAGALNYALEKVDPRTELIGVIDADYHVDPDFLSCCVPLFDDEDLAFVQTPQDYRDADVDPYFRRLYHSYAYFFDVSQRSRNERNGAIFGGTMGLIVRDALVEAGGWDEWCVTEDAELSLRLLRAGWSGTHVDHSFGRGIMPLTFEALKRQRFRWCFGGIQLLRLHWRSLLPGRRTDHNELTLGQRWAYLTGGLQWFGDLAALVFTGFLLLGAVNVFAGDGLAVRDFSAPLLVSVLGLVLLGSLRSVALLRRASHTRWSEAFGAHGIWLALGWVVALASARGLVAREGVFLRTPKVREHVGWRDSLRANLAEGALALLCLTGATLAFGAALDGTVAGLVVGVLLLVQGAAYAAAPVNSLAAARADLTPELRRRRREGLVSWSRVTPGVRRWGIGPAFATAAAAAVVLLVAAPVGMPGLDDVSGDDAPTGAPTGTAVRPGTQSPTPTTIAPLTLSPFGPTTSAADQSTTTPTAQQVADRPTRAPSAATTPPANAPTTPAVATTQPAQGNGRPTAMPTQAASPTKKPR